MALLTVSLFSIWWAWCLLLCSCSPPCPLSCLSSLSLELPLLVMTWLCLTGFLLLPTPVVAFSFSLTGTEGLATYCSRKWLSLISTEIF